MSVPEEVRAKILVEEVVIENFKSIKRLVLKLKPGVNLLVGPNAGGKTNILEAIYFLYRALVEEPSRSPYMPHSPQYWSPVDLLYNRDPSARLRYEIGLRYLVKDRGRVLEFRPRFVAEFAVTPDRGTIIPVYLALDYSGDAKLEFFSGGLRFFLRQELFGYVKELGSDVERLASGLMKVADGFYVMERSFGELGAQSLAALLSILFTPLYAKERVVEVERGVVAVALLIYPWFPIPLALRGRVVSEDEFRGFDLGSEPPVFTPFGVREVLKGVTLLKHPDIGALREPRHLAQMERLDPRATNLAPVLFALVGRRGGFPDRIMFALSRLFPGTRIRLSPQFGRVAITVEENGLELPPPNIADGMLKLLAILTAVELGPSILLIDEIENSMHAEMLEYVIDELNSLEIPVLVATHSPIVVDLVGPERTYVVRKELGTGTVIEGFGNAEELRRRLGELGVAFSDYVFYEKTRSGS